MKGVLVFKLPEEQQYFDLAQNSWKFKSILSDIDQELRSTEKHGEGASAKHAAVWRAKLWDIIKEYKVDLYD
jgi:hypothetical protein